MKILRFAELQKQYGLGVQIAEPTRLKPMYSLFEKRRGEWKRISVKAYPAPFAAKVWGDTILMNPFTFCVKKVKIENPYRIGYRVSGPAFG